MKEATNKLRSVLGLTFTTMFLSACGGGSGITESKPNIGVFNDALVEGVAYSTATLSGFTNENGEFEYNDGETVSFKLNDIPLGEVNARAEVNVAELENGVVVAKLLQSLDTNEDDGLINVNDIVISDVVKAQLISVIVDGEAEFDNVFTQAVMDQIEADSEVVFVQDDPVTTEEAIEHISENITTEFTNAELSNQIFVDADDEFIIAFFDDGTSIDFEEENDGVEELDSTWKLENGKLLIDYPDETTTTVVQKASVDNNKFTLLVEDGDDDLIIATLYQALPLSIADLDGKILSFGSDGGCIQRTIKFTDNSATYKEICTGEFDEDSLTITTHATLNNVLILAGTNSDGEAFEVQIILYKGTVSDGEFAFLDDEGVDKLTLEEVDSEVSESDVTAREVDNDLTATVSLLDSRLTVVFNTPMYDDYGTSGSYIPENSYWTDTKTFIIDFASYTPGGTITLRAEDFISLENKIMSSDIVFVFPG